MAIEHDIKQFDSTMRITSIMLHEYMDNNFYDVYHVNAPEFIQQHMHQKLSLHLSKNFINISMKFDDEKEKKYLINKLFSRCRGIVKDLQKYKYNEEIQYYFRHMSELYTIPFNDELYNSDIDESDYV